MQYKQTNLYFKIVFVDDYRTCANTLFYKNTRLNFAQNLRTN